MLRIDGKVGSGVDHGVVEDVTWVQPFQSCRKRGGGAREI
jgi:hypothetical protein